MRKKLIPEKIRELRDLAWMSQQDLADAAGLSLFTIQRIERGEGGVHGKTGRAIAEALGVTPDELTNAPKAEPLRERQVEPPAGAVEESERPRMFLSRRFDEFEEQARKIAAGEATPLTAPNLVLAMQDELRKADWEGLPANVLGDYMAQADELTEDVMNALEKQKRVLDREIVAIRERKEFFAARGESEDPQRVEAG